MQSHYIYRLQQFSLKTITGDVNACKTFLKGNTGTLNSQGTYLLPLASAQGQSKDINNLHFRKTKENARKQHISDCGLPTNATFSSLGM